MEAISEQAITKLSEFDAQQLSGTFWAYDLLEIGNLLSNLLDSALPHFSSCAQVVDDLCWVSTANVACTPAARIAVKAAADIDEQFRNRLLGPALQHYVALALPGE